MRRSFAGFLCVVAGMALLGAAFPGVSAAQSGAPLGAAPGIPTEAERLSVAETEDLVRRTWFEGMPEDVAARIGPAGAERLLDMLADPAERKNDARILIALGLASPPGTLAAIEGWAAAMPTSGELDRPAFAAWQALPFALGHLAERDPEAVVALEAILNAEPPAWTFRQHRGARLSCLSRRSAATALALTGEPEARRVLERAGRNLSDPDFQAHLDEMRALHTERARARATARPSSPAAEPEQTGEPVVPTESTR